MKHKNIIKIVVVSLVLFIIGIIGFYINYKNNNHITMKEQEYDNMFSIQIEQSTDDGKIEWVTYNKNTWPSSKEGYVLNLDMSFCQDKTLQSINVNDVLSYNAEADKVNVKTSKALRCYLYFNKGSVTKPSEGGTPGSLNCELKMTNNNIEWLYKDTSTYYMITTSNKIPDNLSNNTSLTVTSPGTYYGYLKNSDGSYGQCKINVANVKPNKCTVTKVNSAQGKCSTVGGSGSNNCVINTYSATCGELCDADSVYTTGNCKPYSTPSKLLSSTPTSSCDGFAGGGGATGSGVCTNIIRCECQTSGSTSYNCSDGSTCSTSGCCENKDCEIKSYSCSNGIMYDTEKECTDKECPPCDYGYIKSGNYCYLPDYPTCELQVTSNGVEFKSKTDDITASGKLDFGLVLNGTKTYNKKSTLKIESGVYGTYTGYVKDSDGNEGKCSLNVQKPASETKYYQSHITVGCQGGGGSGPYGQPVTDSKCTGVMVGYNPGPGCSASITGCQFVYTEVKCSSDYMSYGNCKALDVSGCVCYKIV